MAFPNACKNCICVSFIEIKVVNSIKFNDKEIKFIFIAISIRSDKRKKECRYLQILIIGPLNQVSFQRFFTNCVKFVRFFEIRQHISNISNLKLFKIFCVKIIH